ncbi:hypothetical protein ANN_17196 [Periplaneta americana]|uniref:Uncharacterized protein n=1 Tax=Periplaneta americana TaxID=6978 RepID=A0ABQ8STG2_PERAM|nr:hypothetical protein ANN_17196 [Periplaneta americana]
MSPGSSIDSYLVFAHTGLRENPGKSLNQGLLLRNSRHHLVRSKIAAALRTKGWIVEEISCLAENGSTRRVDILAYNADTKQGIIVDPTIRFEVGCHQSAEVHLEKKSIYEPTVNYFKLKYALIHVESRCPRIADELWNLIADVWDDVALSDRYSRSISKALLILRSSTRVCVRICVSIRRPEFECSGPQLEGPEFECSGPQLEGPEFEYSELSLKVCGSRYRELE